MVTYGCGFDNADAQFDNSHFDEVWTTEAATLTDAALSGTFSIDKVQSETLNLTVSIIKAITQTALTESLSLTDSLTPLMIKTLTEALNLTDAAPIFDTIKVLSNSLFVTDTVPRDIKKYVSDTLNLADSVIKNLQRALSDSMTLTDLTIIKSTDNVITDSLNLTDLAIKSTATTKTDALNMTDTKILFTTKQLTDGLTLADSVIKIIQRLLTDNASFSEVINRITTTTKTESLNLTDSAIKDVIKYLIDTLNNTDLGFIFSMERTLRDSLTMTDIINKALKRELAAESINLNDANVIKLIGKLCTTFMQLSDLGEGLKELKWIFSAMLQKGNQWTAQITSPKRFKAETIEPKEIEGDAI